MHTYIHIILFFFGSYSFISSPFFIPSSPHPTLRKYMRIHIFIYLIQLSLWLLFTYFFFLFFLISSFFYTTKLFAPYIYCKISGNGAASFLHTGGSIIGVNPLTWVSLQPSARCSRYREGYISGEYTCLSTTQVGRGWPCVVIWTWGSA